MLTYDRSEAMGEVEYLNLGRCGAPCRKSTIHIPKETIKMATKAKPATQSDVPSGYKAIAEDIVGFWKPEEGPIEVEPLFVKLSDSKIDSAKSSTLIFCKLVKATTLYMKDDVEVEGKAGDLVGIWGKPGMRAIRNCGSVPTFLMLKDKKEWVDVGKGNHMKTFVVAPKDGIKGDRLAVEEDNRKDSKPQTSDGRSEVVGSPPDDDDIPF